MKALKEKRISLRSLWRRGLVILSLFALVFASCGESDTPAGTAGGKVIAKVVVKTAPTNDQYLGQLVDLEGTVLDVYYADGTKEPVKYSNGNFTSVPKVFTGAYIGTNFTGMPNVQIVYNNFSDTIAIPYNEGVKAWGIVRTDAKSFGLVDGPIWGVDPAYNSLGLHLTGKPSKEDYYVDDNYFDFSGLTLEADYFYLVSPPTATNPNWDYLRDKKKVPFSNVSYAIQPSYKLDDDKDSSGVIAITVGEDVTNQMYWYMLFAGVTNGNEGITTSHMLDKVHIVTDITVKGGKPDLGDYYYWEDNSRDAWADRFPEGAQLTVTYSNGKTKDLAIEDLTNQAKIWWNAMPEDSIPGPATGTPGTPNTGIPNNPGPGSYDFDIVPIQYPLTIKANPEPGIVLYYRGATRKIKVDVLTTLLNVAVTAKDPSGINFDPAATQDNDIFEGEKGTRGLAKLIDVKATYGAYNDSSVQRDITLDYIAFVNDEIAASRVAVPYKPYYTFDKGTGDDSTYETGYTKWEAAALKGKLDVLPRAVTVGHSVLESDFYDPTNPPNYYPTASRFGGGTYRFKGVPEFYHNLQRAKDKDPTTGVGLSRPSEATGGWEWKDNSAATGGASGSGIKQPAKAKVDKPTVNWIISTPIPEL